MARPGCLSVGYGVGFAIATAMVAVALVVALLRGEAGLWGTILLAVFLVTFAAMTAGFFGADRPRVAVVAIGGGVVALGLLGLMALIEPHSLVVTDAGRGPHSAPVARVVGAVFVLVAIGIAVAGLLTLRGRRRARAADPDRGGA